MLNFRLSGFLQLIILLIASLHGLVQGTIAHAEYLSSDLLPCSPSSEYLETEGAGLNLPFCAQWNPDFAKSGSLCCPVPPTTARRSRGRGRRRRGTGGSRICHQDRVKPNYCDEMTPEQRLYSESVNSGKVGDVLAQITMETGLRGAQSYCSVNNGFLAWGRRLIPSSENRVHLRNSGRCTEFGTDPMVGMIEWAGRQVARTYPVPEYAGVKLVVGDISAPRGGCLAGRNGRVGHSSHTTGQDADIGFLTVNKSKQSPMEFHRDFDPKTNWWLLKELFHNPFACVKVVFLDRKMINRLSRVAAKDPEWMTYRKFIRHIRGHQNHLHVRIGNTPGAPGCGPGARPDLELEPEEEAELIQASDTGHPDSSPSSAMSPELEEELQEILDGGTKS